MQGIVLFNFFEFTTHFSKIVYQTVILLLGGCAHGFIHHIADFLDDAGKNESICIRYC
jgi:hypothetical protein